MCKLLDDFLATKRNDDAIIIHDVVDSLFSCDFSFNGFCAGRAVFNDDTAVVDIWDMDTLVDGYRADVFLGTITVDVNGDVIDSTISRSILADVVKCAGVTLCC